MAPIHELVLLSWVGNDPSQWPQSAKTSETTRAHPSDDQQGDAALPSGTTSSKTWAHRSDRPFWLNTYSQPAGASSSSATAAALPQQHQSWLPHDVARRELC